MITFEVLFAFIVYAVVSSFTPGPNNMMVMASGLNYGIRRTIPHITGISIGFGVMVFLAGIGLLSILDRLPILYQIIHVLSVLYLLYLAWKIATASPLDGHANPKKKPMTFLQAAAFQWVNPKALVMALAAITTYVPDAPESAFLLNVTIVAIVFALISLPSAFLWTVCGNEFRRFLHNPLYCRIFNVTMALLLVLSLYPLLSEIHITLH